MFDFLKRLRGIPEEIKEGQRARFERLITELNEAIADLPEKPAVTITPESGTLSFDLPEQFPDEALALPKPDAEAAAGDASEAEGENKGEAEPDENSARADANDTEDEKRDDKAA
jgi:hypothetical protein